ncbi:low-density lipoprotein receptor-related protein-like isoform X2 [Phymastichus coffea]|uniref:low-density lipoprotein receptor-related protein-like isoform X2 n=1 Tax=Phymastichus coffea TaxID=108790 RepID=UPI00273C2268|nr:low-density lipoprotein receptor-related protein-like isoform X2 [Phymastichus coffea]
MRSFVIASVFTALIASAITASVIKKHNSTTRASKITVAPKKPIESTRQSRCSSATQFQCENGECITTALVCNGYRDCKDGTDEKFSICFSPGGRQITTSTNKRYGGVGDRGAFTCADYEFLCTSGECINQQYVCDRINHCSDGSDEFSTICPSGFNGSGNNGRKCLGTEFQCRNGECIFGGYRCDGIAHCFDSSDEDWSICQNVVKKRPTGTNQRDNNGNQGGNDTYQGGSGGNNGNNWEQRLIRCNIPPHPSNGRWKLHRSLCDSNIECRAPSDMKTMNPGSYLVYSCDKGFMINGTSDVLCGPDGQWIHTPKCDQVKCPDLSSSTTEALCTWKSTIVSCEIPVPIDTIADLNCRKGFVQEVMYEQAYKQVKCQPDGKWSPKPIRCVKKPRKIKLVLEGDMIILGE